MSYEDSTFALILQQIICLEKLKQTGVVLLTFPKQCHMYVIILETIFCQISQLSHLS